MLRPPPRSPLFPYTTLFRSLVERYGDFVRYKPPRDSRTLVLWYGPFALLGFGLLMLVVIVLRRRTDTGSEADGGLDRKSTRLNSSHVRISYAVFCLKKKKE